MGETVQQSLRVATVVASVKRWRKIRGWSARQLAEELAAIGLPAERSMIANLEAGRRENCTIDELAAFGQVFSVDPWSLTRPFVCPRCAGSPPTGYVCMTCGASAGAGGEGAALALEQARSLAGFDEEVPDV